MTVDRASELFREGRLDDAVRAAEESVRALPSAGEARIRLAELLLVAGALERADKVLETAAMLDPGLCLTVSEFRQLIRASVARRDIRTSGRLPDFVGEPAPSMRHVLEALVALQVGDEAAAARAADLAEAARPRASALVNARAVDDWRDADDLNAGHFEILTVTGKCFWVASERIRSASFHKPERLRDLVWRRCDVVVADGPEGVVYVPALYLPEGAVDDARRLGRTSAWSETAPIRGQGQRVFLAGDDAVTFDELATLEAA